MNWRFSEELGPALIPVIGWRPALWIRFSLIGLAVLVGKFLFASEFGFYEDDYLQILPFYGTRWDQVLGLMWSELRTWPHGEPIGFAINDLHAYLVTRFDSLAVPYVLGAVLITVSGCLFYVLVRRSLPDFAAFIGACVFVLYPVDTSEQIIANQPAQVLNLILILLALLLYRRHRVWAYALALCVLLNYEHFFLPFVAAPFFLERGERLSLRKCISHGFFIASSCALLILVRDFIGEARARGVLVDSAQVLTRVPSAVGIGLLNSLTTFFARILDAFLHGDFFSWTVVLVIGFCFGIALGPLKSLSLAGSAGRRTRKDILLIGFGALVAAGSGYVLAFRPDNYPPVLNLGRLSGFNAPASIGICLLVACAISLALRLGEAGRFATKWLSIIAISALVAAGVYIQRVDYVASWANQKLLLRQLLATSGSWKPDTTVVIDMDQSECKPFETPGFSLTWLSFDLTYVPRYLIDFNALPLGRLPDGQTLQPSEAGFSQLSIRLLDGNLTYPRAIGYSKYSDVAVAETGCVRLELPIADPLFRVFLKDGNFQLFRMRDRKLERVKDPIWSIAGVSLKQDESIDETRAPLSLSPVGKMLLGDAPLWPSVEGGKMYPNQVPFKDLQQ